MKKLLSAALAASLTLSLAACGSSAASSAPASSEAASSEAASSAAADSTAAESTNDLAGTKLVVAASPTPHAEILEVAKDILAEQGITLEIKEFSDYVQPNLVTENGEVDANYFQHTPYLDSFNAENGTHLVSVGAIHYEPFGIYPGKSNDLANIADGATIAVPNDTTNEARALQLLAAQGIITVREGAGLTATVNDIEENPHNVKIQEIEAAQLPRTVQDVDFAVINGNYAMEAGFSVGKDALATEDASSEAAQTYANVLVVKEGNENSPAIQALLAAQGLITVRDGAGLTATINDITENPHNLKIEEIEAAQLPRTVQDVDFAVINGNYAMEAGFSVGKDALATEDASSEAAQTYANVLVVKEGNENDPAIQALYAALTSDKVKEYINSTYDGAVVPIF